MAVRLCLSIKGWLNVACTLLKADYIGFLMFEVRSVIDAVNLRKFLASLVYKEQFYIWFLGGILCG